MCSIEKLNSSHRGDDSSFGIGATQLSSVESRGCLRTQCDLFRNERWILPIWLQNAMQHAHLFVDSNLWENCGSLPGWHQSTLVGKKDILQHSLEAIARSETPVFFLLGKTTHNQLHWKPISHEGPNVCQAEWIDVSYKEMQRQSLKIEVFLCLKLPFWESRFHCWSRIIHSESETTYLSGPWWIPVVKHRHVFRKSRRFSNQSSKTRSSEISLTSEAWNLCATLPMCRGASCSLVP